MLRQRRALHEGEHQKHDLEHGFWQRRAPKARSRARFLARGRAPKSTIFGTRESTKKHDFVHEGGHQKARSRARFFCTRESTELRKTLKTTFAQNIKKSFFWLLQLLGRTQIMLTKTVQWYIYLCIDFISLLVLWIFARLQKTALLQKKCSRGFIPSTLSVGFATVFEFAFCGYLRSFCANFRWASVASKQTIPVFSRARVAKRK